MSMITDITQVKAVDIIVLDTGCEAPAIREALEGFNIQTRMHYIGNVKHLISLLRSHDYLHKTIIISCHGEQGRMVLPELAQELERSMPYKRRLTSSDLLEFLNLKGHTVINTGCGLGHDEFAASFLAKGSKNYIGATDYIEGSAGLMFVIAFCYFYFSEGTTIDVAFDKAYNLDNETKLFKLWKEEGL